MQTIILCGGFATRLGEATKTVPKILIDIADRTVLEWQIQLLKDANVQEVILASGHLHDVLYQRVGTYYAGVHVRYAKEKKKLGTGGAIRNAMQHIHTSPFFVLNGDVLLNNFSLQEMLHNFYRGINGLLLSVHVPDIQAYGEILSDSDGKITAFREKQPIRRSGYINSGVYLLSQTIAEAFPNGQEHFSIERDVFPKATELYTLKSDADWIDIGTPERLVYAREHFRNGVSQ